MHSGVAGAQCMRNPFSQGGRNMSRTVRAQTSGQKMADKQGRVVENRPEAEWRVSCLDWLASS